MNKFLNAFSKSNSRRAKPEDVAKVIYRAATNSSNQLHYLVNPGPLYWLNRFLSNALWRRLLVKAMVK